MATAARKPIANEAQNAASICGRLLPDVRQCIGMNKNAINGQVARTIHHPAERDTETRGKDRGPLKMLGCKGIT